MNELTDIPKIKHQIKCMIENCEIDMGIKQRKRKKLQGEVNALYQSKENLKRLLADIEKGEKTNE